jgi:hypothetical protein
MSLLSPGEERPTVSSRAYRKRSRIERPMAIDERTVDGMPLFNDRICQHKGNNFKACPVYSEVSDSSYRCIDTSSRLEYIRSSSSFASLQVLSISRQPSSSYSCPERTLSLSRSCGGCPNRGGVDCSELEGVDSVSCQQGRCVAGELLSHCSSHRYPLISTPA